MKRKLTLFGLATFFLLSCLGTSCNTASSNGSSERQKNVLFIAVDDLRPELGCYGIEKIQSPNIDRLASSGLLFERAYCQQAVCSPSRTSLLTGARPDTTKVYDLKTHFRTTIPNVVTLPQHFKNNGYHSAWWGKLFHASLLDPVSWSEQGERLEPESNWRAYVTPENIAHAAGNKGGGYPFEMADVPDSAYPDGQIADRALETLNRIKDRPFFLAVGFYKPHLPFNAPKKYWDLYDADSFQLPSHNSRPKDAPEIAFSNWGELRSYYGIPKEGPVSDEMGRKMIHAYYAAVSYTDAQIGKLLDELDRLGLTDNTVVVLWGDHGWKLGDYGDWCKATNFELDTHAPLIVRSPGMKGAGQKTDALVEFVDIYPTLCDLTGLPQPSHLEGTSFARLLEDPAQPWEEAAFSQYPRSGGQVMGYSMRTDRYRLTRWQEVKDPSKVVALELYDHQEDPLELVNVATREENAAIVKELEQQLLRAISR